MDSANVPQKDQGWNEIDIYLFSNGQQNSPPRKYHLCADELNWWEATLHFLARSHYGPLHSNIEIYTLSGKKIKNPLELTNDTAYVAVEPPDPLIHAGYEKYLMKATKSWEKRQQKLIEAAELHNEEIGQRPTSAKLEKTSPMQIVIEETVKNTKKPETDKNNRSAKTSSLSSDKVPIPANNSKSYMKRITPTKPLLTSIMPRKSSLKKKDNIEDNKTNTLNFSSQDPIKNKTKNKFLSRKTNKTESNVEGLVDNNSKSLSETVSKDPGIHQIRILEEEKESVPFLYKNPEPDIVSNFNIEDKGMPLNQRNSIRHEENTDVTDDLLTISNNVRTKRDFFERESINSHDYSLKDTKEYDKVFLDMKEEFQNVIMQLSGLKNDNNDSIANEQLTSQTHNELQPELQKQLESIVRHVVKTLFDMNPNNNITLTTNNESPDSIQRELNDNEMSQQYPNGIEIIDVHGEKIVTLVNKGDSVNLKLNIELKHLDQESNDFAQQMVQNVTKTDQHSQVNFNFALKQISSQHILLSQSTEFFEYSKMTCCEERTEYIIIQCDCAENTNFNDNAQSDYFNSKFMLLVPKDQIHSKTTSKIAAIKVDKKSSVSMQTEINPSGSAITIRRNILEDDGSVTAKRSVVYINEPVNSDQESLNKNVEESKRKNGSLQSPRLSREWLEVKKNVSDSEHRSFVDSSTQTSWCDIVIEARIKENGQCSLHLPPLHVIKQCDFVKQ